MTSYEKNIIFQFGISGDIQYADCENGTTFDGKIIRRYRQSLRSLHETVQLFNLHKIEYCVLLGDILDGKTANLNQVDRCLSEVLELLTKYSQKWHYSFGNHDFYALTRPRLVDLIPIPEKVSNNCSARKLYYHFAPKQGIRFIILDPYEISTFGATNEYNKILADSIMSANNPNVAIPNSDWTFGLTIEQQKYVPYNGSLSDEQLIWLQNILDISTNNKELIFIFSHVAIYANCVSPSGLVWNNEEVLKIVQSSSHVVCFISGHDHIGGYAIDEYGIHHIVAPSPLECDVDEVTFGYFNLYQNDFELIWYGKIPEKSYHMWPTKMSYPSSIQL